MIFNLTIQRKKSLAIPCLTASLAGYNVPRPTNMRVAELGRLLGAVIPQHQLVAGAHAVALEACGCELRLVTEYGETEGLQKD